MEAVKIGFTSSNPHVRLSGLQIGCPAPLKLLTYVPGSMDDERRLHKAFAPLHIQGEWFRFEGKLRDLTYYLSPIEPGPVGRESFEGALHDVLMQGLWHPNDPMSEDDYYATGDWEPFHELLWKIFGPWEDA
jgi:hypothetical protein